MPCSPRFANLSRRSEGRITFGESPANTPYLDAAIRTAAFSRFWLTLLVRSALDPITRAWQGRIGRRVSYGVKPGVRETLRADLDAMYLACRKLELIDPNLEARVGLSAIVEDARASILAETDLIKERQNMQVFESFLRQAGPYFQQVTVPRTYEVRKRECECARACCVPWVCTGERRG